MSLPKFIHYGTAKDLIFYYNLNKRQYYFVDNNGRESLWISENIAKSYLEDPAWENIREYTLQDIFDAELKYLNQIEVARKCLIWLATKKI